MGRVLLNGGSKKPTGTGGMLRGTVIHSRVIRLSAINCALSNTTTAVKFDRVHTLVSFFWLRVPSAGRRRTLASWCQRCHRFSIAWIPRPVRLPLSMFAFYTYTHCGSILDEWLQPRRAPWIYIFQIESSFNKKDGFNTWRKRFEYNWNEKWRISTTIGFVLRIFNRTRLITLFCVKL